MTLIGYTWMQARTPEQYVVAEVWRKVDEELELRPLRPDFPSCADAARVAVDMQADLEGV